jgi:hypothetical protein
LKITPLLAGAVLAIAASGAANAAITVYNAASTFGAATGALTLGVDSFNDLTTDNAIATPLSRAAGAFGYTATASTSTFYAAGAAADRWLTTDTPSAVMTFSGFTDISAISGLFFDSNINGGFAAGAIKVTVTDSLGATSAVTISNATVSSFEGFTSNGFITSLQVQAVQPNRVGFLWPTLNTLTLGGRSASAAVPEPAAWAMMIFGLGMAGATLRARKASLHFG